MQIISGVCDVHLSHPLDRTFSIVCSLAGTTDTLTIKARGNQAVDCNRYYEPSRSYFTADESGRFERGNPNAQPQCRRHQPEMVFMYVAKKDRELVWTCPECGATQEFTGVAALVANR